jgi:hypothetical protein
VVDLVEVFLGRKGQEGQPEDRGHHGEEQPEPKIA